MAKNLPCEFHSFHYARGNRFWVAMQAIAVGVFAELQYVGLRRSRDAPTS
jgi:hypothetical protein